MSVNKREAKHKKGICLVWANRRAVHTQLVKAESSALVQVRTGKIGLAHFFYTYGVMDIHSASCDRGRRKQQVKYVLDPFVRSE